MRPPLLLLSLLLAVAPLAQAARAQTPGATVAAAPAVTQSTAEQIDSALNAAVQHLRDKKFDEAIQSAKQALALSQSVGDLAHQLRSANILALAHFRIGQTEEAIRRFKEAAAIAAQAHDRASEALALSRAGSMLRVSGLYEEALFCFSRAITLYQQEKNRSGEVLALTSLSTVYSESGDFAKARQQLQVALPIAGELKDKVLDEALLLKLGIVEYECGNHELALKFGLQALELDVTQDGEAIDREINKSFDQTGVMQQRTFGLTRLELYLHLGNVYAALADYQKAFEFFQRGLAESQKPRRPLIAAVNLGNMAGAQLRLGKAKEARDLAIRAIADLRNSGGSKHWEATFLYYLAEANRALGLNDEALVSYRQAIEAIEQARSLSIPTEVSRAGIVAARHDVFAGAIDFLVSQHREEEALAIAEAWHARAFLDILTESRIDLRKDLSGTERDREDKIFAHISAIQKQIWSPSLAPAREQELKGELAAAESALESFQLEVRRTNPLYASIKYPAPVKPAIIAGELVDENSALIEYVLGDKHSFAWVVRRGKISSFVLPPKKEIEDLIAPYREALSGRVSALTATQSITKINEQSRQIYRTLLWPLAEQLEGAAKLIIVSDGVLSYLPFETLVAAETKGAEPVYLLEKFAIAYAPSASALAAVRATDTRGRAEGFVAFGDPNYSDSNRNSESVPGALRVSERGLDLRQLPYTRNEVTGIAAVFPIAERRLFLGAEANEGSVKIARLDSYRYVHFATHGIVDEENPTRSGLFLSFSGSEKEDGILQVTEIMRLKLNADLVTLSACRTGLGKVVRGEGVLGLTRAFQYAGARSVVVSLWNVNDIATADLMKDFYQNLKRGLAKDEALRQAKLALLKGKQRTWQHPYFWAPFVLVGANN